MGLRQQKYNLEKERGEAFTRGEVSGKEPISQSRRQKRLRVQFLGWEDPLEEGMATHSSILAWSFPWTENSGRLQSIESQRVGLNGSDLAHTDT